MSSVGLQKKILVIDDEDIVCQLLNDILKLEGFDVLACNSGEEAVAIYQERSSDISLVLCDMFMPNMSGEETFLQLKMFNPAVKVIILSGYSSDVGIASLRDKGVSRFITKPINILELRRAVNKIMVEVPSSMDATSSSNIPDYDIVGLAQMLPGFNVVSALQGLNQRMDLYLNLIAQFRVRYRDTVANMYQLYCEDQLTEVLALAHNVKSLAGNIGAEQLQGIAAKIEELIYANVTGQSLLPYLHKFKSVFEECLRLLDRIIIKQEDSVNQVSIQKDCSVKQLRQVLEGLLHEVIAHNPVKVRKLLKEIACFNIDKHYGSDIQQITELTIKYQFNEAARIIEELLKKI